MLPCSGRAQEAFRRAPGGRMGQKSAFQAALAPPRGDFSADVARLLPVPDRDFRLDFCGEGPRLYGVSLACSTFSATLRTTARVTFSLHWHRSSLRVPTTAGWLSTKLLPGMQLAHTALAAHAAPRSARPGAQPAWDGCLAHLCPGRQDHTRGEPGQRPAQGCRVSGVPAPAARLAACTRARRSTPAQLPTPDGVSGVARGLPPGSLCVAAPLLAADTSLLCRPPPPPPVASLPPSLQ